jgi:hypothetical protein
MLLVSGTIPHHHHESVLCMVVEICESDNSINDEHTNHYDDSNMAHDHLCVAESDFIIPQDNSEIKSSDLSCDNSDHICFFPVFFLVSSFLHDVSAISVSGSKYGESHLFYTSTEASQIHGLRAPPLFS